jgi:hypothetical protein
LAFFSIFFRGLCPPARRHKHILVLVDWVHSFIEITLLLFYLKIGSIGVSGISNMIIT